MPKGTSGARKFVVKSVIEIGVIVGVVYGAAYLARKYNIGAKTTSSLVGAGEGVASGILAPFQGLVSGVTTGTEGIVSQLDTANKALFGQIAASTNAFNNFIHPDWYNADGSYSTKNPNYNAGLPGNGNPQFGNSLPPTSTNPQTDPNAPAVDNSANTGSNGNPPSSSTSRPTQRPSTTNPTQPGSNLTPRSAVITTIKPTTSLPLSGEITPARTVSTSTQVRGLPLNQTLTNIVKAGGTVQSAVINTTTGGTREVAGSPGLLARLAANLKSTK